MEPRQPSRWRRLLRYRTAYKRIIPPETRVDPALFPEEEFPVVCPKCSYLLRGLPDNRCPECGREFDRGRLLVEQYLIEMGRRLWRGTGTWARRTFIASLVVMSVFALVVPFAMWRGHRDPNFFLVGSQFWLPAFVISSLSVWGTAVLLGLVSGGLFLRLAIVSRGKRRRVFEAIDQSEPMFSSAQRYWWVVLVAWLALFAPVLALEARCEGATGYSVMLTAGFVVVGGCFIVPVGRLLPRFRAR